MEDDAEDYMISDAELERRSEKEPVFFTYAVYLEDRAYGGPEEGGWWYDYGEFCDSVAPVCIHVNDMEMRDGYPCSWEKFPEPYRSLIQKMHDWCDENNKGRPSTGSVLSQGRYAVCHFRGLAPKYWPRERPHYE